MTRNIERQPGKPFPDMQAARDEIDRKLQGAVDELLRRDWGPAGAAEQTGEYPQILRDVVQISMLNNRTLLAEYLEVISSETLKISTSQEDNLAIADKANNLREEAEMEGVVPLARAAAQSTARSQAAPKEPTELGRIAATAWKIVSRVVAVAGALLLVAFAVAIAVFDSPGVTVGTRIGTVVFLLGGAGILVLVFFFPGWQSRIFRRISERTVERTVERTLRRNLKARYRR